jgi:hypothetical protein
VANTVSSKPLAYTSKIHIELLSNRYFKILPSLAQVKWVECGNPEVFGCKTGSLSLSGVMNTEAWSSRNWMIEAKDRKGWGIGQNRRREQDPLRAAVPQIITMKMTRPKYIKFSRSRLVFGNTQVLFFHICALKVDYAFNFFSEAAPLRTLLMSVSTLSSLYVNLAPIFRNNFD